MRKMLFIAIFFLASVAFVTGGAWGVVEHCVVDETQLQDELILAESNGDDDIIKVVQGTYTGNFSFDSDEGYSIQVQRLRAHRRGAPRGYWTPQTPSSMLKVQAGCCLSLIPPAAISP